MKNIKNLWLITFACIFSGGCMSSGPKNAVGFAKPLSVKQLEGCYENKGDGGPGGSRYLSSYVFPSAKLDAKTIQYIHVLSLDQNKLKVIALSNGKTLKEAILVNGKDFNLTDGKIKIGIELGAIAPAQPGNVFLGVAQGSKYIGIDANGDGKLQESSALAGKVFFSHSCRCGGRGIFPVQKIQWFL